MDNRYGEGRQPGRKDKDIWGFFLKEQRERAEIERKSKAFKKAVDIEKESLLKDIDDKRKQKEAIRNRDRERLEAAITSGNASRIKAALKDFHI